MRDACPSSFSPRVEPVGRAARAAGRVGLARCAGPTATPGASIGFRSGRAADLPKRLRTPVLYVHHRSELGGAPASLSYLIRELDEEQFEPHIYCPPGPAAELFREAGARVHTGPVSGFTHIWASTYRGRRWLLFARELALLPPHVVRFRRTLRRHRFELVHFNDSPLIPAAWLARRERLPVVWHLRSALPDGGKDRRSAFVRAAIRRLATTSIAITHDVASVFGVGSTVVPNSVDLERFRPGDPPDAKTALGLPPDRPVVSYFGFIYPSKGFREFIEAAARLRDRGLDASYLIVGGAVRGEEFFRTLVGRSLQLADLTRNYESEAKRLVDELGLTELFRFVPFTQDTANLYQASDVVVAPSQGPELGRPVIEAAASGVPVVASGSRTGGGVVVPGETGVLVEDFGPDTLANAVAELLAEPGRRERFGHTARAHAERNFDPAKNARRIEGIYRRIAPQRERIPVLYVHHRPAAGRRAVLARAADPPPRRALRAARLLPGRAGRGAVRRRRRGRPHGRGLDLRPRLGQPLRGPQMARVGPRGRGPAAAPPAARAADAAAQVPRRPSERLAAARGGDGLAPPRREGRLAPPLRARGRGARPALARDRDDDGALGRRGDRDRPRRRRALPDPAAADDRPQLGRAARLAETAPARPRSAFPPTASRSASPASSAGRRAGPSWSRPPTSSSARARPRTS